MGRYSDLLTMRVTTTSWVFVRGHAHAEQLTVVQVAEFACGAKLKVVEEKFVIWLEGGTKE